MWQRFVLVFVIDKSWANLRIVNFPERVKPRAAKLGRPSMLREVFGRLRADGHSPREGVDHSVVIDRNI
jgi:hypothetical protein